MNGYQRKRIDEALKYGHLLDDYQLKFVKKMDSKSDSYELSDNQNKLLNKIGEIFTRVRFPKKEQSNG